ncbi:response regulator [Desulfobotulus mexicanus]|uniref:Response regulator n=1 Tax=Desulfobotulus mexicanus TaxID=2586642 RepID=A0A5S5MC26_9BACT|nr:response regulator [Desulfobotulus mexicanus]TYT73288.1 response regulator [Desulfobotulus mexicanus]
MGLHPQNSFHPEDRLSQQKIFIVEDDARLATLISEYLGQNGYRTQIIPRGDLAIIQISTSKPDLVILDLMLPGQDGLSVCREIRKNYQGPVLILTAREDEMDEVAALEMGADDYVKKPVVPRVLLARIRALFRRNSSGSAPEGGASSLTFGSLHMDLASRSVFLENRPVELSTVEFSLLSFLASHAGEVLSREKILASLRGISYDGLDRSVDMYISRLRKKLGDHGSRPCRIKTVWGEGYLFARDAW